MKMEKTMTGSLSVIRLVTGSGGLIGLRLSEQLAETFAVVGFDRPGGPESASFDNIPVNLTSAESLNNGVQTVRYRYGSCLTSVIHLA
jgi:nucleoside-diphosphate-sugar epimerase